MQPYLFPYLGYFQLLNAVDKFILLDDVNYINKGWINRNRVLVNGTEFTFTVPLKDASQNKLIKDIAIADDDKWRSKLLRTIEMSYKKAPFADRVMPILIAVVKSNTTMIADLIYQSLELVMQYIGITTGLVKTSSVFNIMDLKGEERILAICQKAGAAHYINLIGGKELYSPERFAAAGIKLNFLRASLDPYDQTTAAFVPGLSIIDVLMHNPPEKVREFLLNYTLE